MINLIVTSYFYGHAIHWDEIADGWRYSDNDALIDVEGKRLCPKCKRGPTKDGHDPCIANLPGIISACCGHGVEDGFILFEDDETIIGGTFEKIERIKKDSTVRPKKR